MITFEEFFLKKKINLKSLAASKPDLYQEFKSHFTQMGEKSFDHTKKYWFNPLRKDFRLSDEDELKLKEALQTIKIQIQEVVLQEETILPVTIKLQGVKTDTISVKEVEEVKEKKDNIKSAIGFKPKFKAAIVAPKQEELISADPLKEEISKPVGFKPKFKSATSTAPKQKPETGE